MTENDSIEIINDKVETCEFYFAEHDHYPKWCEYEFLEALGIAITALKEIQQYREIGTVEECREARANQKPKIVKDRKWAEKFQGIPYCVQGDCPKCGCKVIKSTNTNYCYVCGPLLNWNDEWTDDDLREFFI